MMVEFDVVTVVGVDDTTVCVPLTVEKIVLKLVMSMVDVLLVLMVLDTRAVDNDVVKDCVVVVWALLPRP